MTKTELKEIPLLSKRIEEKKKTIEILRELAYYTGAIRVGDKIQKSPYNKGHPCIDKLVDLDRRLQVDIDYLLALKLEFTGILDTLDGNEKRLMELRYLNDLKWHEIAGAMNYSVRQIHRMHGEILNKIFSS